MTALSKYSLATLIDPRVFTFFIYIIGYMHGSMHGSEVHFSHRNQHSTHVSVKIENKNTLTE